MIMFSKPVVVAGVPSILCSIILLFTAVVTIILSSSNCNTMMMLPSTNNGLGFGSVYGLNTNNNHHISLRSSEAMNRKSNNSNNNNRVSNVIGINNQNRNNAASVLSLVPMDFVDFSSHFSILISTKYEAVQPILTEVTIPLAIIKESAMKVVVSAAGAASASATSSDVQAEILSDSSFAIMQYPAFLPDVKTSKLRIKYAQVIGRILIIDISLLPGHTFHPEELAIQLFLLGASMGPIIRSIKLFRVVTAVRCNADGCTIDFDSFDDEDNTGTTTAVGGVVECTFINNNNNDNNDDNPDLAFLDYNNAVGGSDNNGLAGTLIIENYEDDESSYL